MAMELRMALADEWWVATWLGSEARGSTALEAQERLIARLVSIRHGTAMPGPGERPDFVRSAWPMIESFVARIQVKPPAARPVERMGINEAKDNAEAAVLRAALEAADWNVAKTSRALGLSRFGTIKKMKRLGVERPAR